MTLKSSYTNEARAWMVRGRIRMENYKEKPALPWSTYIGDVVVDRDFK